VLLVSRGNEWKEGFAAPGPGSMAETRKCLKLVSSCRNLQVSPNANGPWALDEQILSSCEYRCKNLKRSYRNSLNE